MRHAKSGKALQQIESTSRLEVRQLRAFVALADLGSITAAAQALGLAQSTVSESLAALERALGVEVVRRQRGSRKALLTSPGLALLPHARKVLEAIDDARVAIARTTRSARTHLDIVTMESVSTYVLPGALSRMRERWPKTRFAVSLAPRAGIADAVAGGAFDVGLVLVRTDECRPARRSPPARAATLPFGRRVVISDLRLVMFASPLHPHAHGALRRNALSAYPLFVSDAAFAFDAFVRRYVRSGRRNAPHVEAAGSVEGVKRAVMADTGALGLLPAYALTEELRLGQVVGLDLRPPPPRMRLDALLSPSRTTHPAIEELLNALRDAFSSAA